MTEQNTNTSALRVLDRTNDIQYGIVQGMQRNPVHYTREEINTLHRLHAILGGIIKELENKKQ
jgi:hypothetical protein